MANEITINLSISAVKGFLSAYRAVQPLRVTLAGTRYSAGVQSIGFAAHEAVVIGSDVGTEGYAWFRNLDADNYVQLGRDVSGTFYPLVKLKPGEAAILRLATDAVYAQAAVGAVNLETLILED